MSAQKKKPAKKKAAPVAKKKKSELSANQLDKVSGGVRFTRPKESNYSQGPGG